MVGWKQVKAQYVVTSPSNSKSRLLLPVQLEQQVRLELRNYHALVLCVRVYILVPTVPRSDSPDVLAPSRKLVRTSAGFAQHEGKELSWDHTLNLIGRAIHRPLIHICEVCDKPILIYGRMVRENVDNFKILGVLCSGGETVLYVLLRPF